MPGQKENDMIVKRNFHPLRVWPYIWREVVYALSISIIVWAGATLLPGGASLALNFTPIGVLGSALAIFVAFRNNSAYGRWWEARQIWGMLINWSRIFARLVITFVDSHRHTAQYDAAAAPAFTQEMVYRHIAFAHALRFHLRREERWEELRPFLPEEEFRQLLSRQNKPNYLLQIQGRRIYDAMASGTLQGFDSFQLEGCLAQFANHQGACERIKNTPLPRQYDFFTRLFVWIFATLLPFGLLSLFLQGGQFSPAAWLVIPLAVVIAAVFTIMEKTGAANEDPFENLVTDVPLTALCNTIERDLKEQLGETALPEKLLPVNGYLW